MIVLVTPGPGSYVLPSEWGNYERVSSQSAQYFFPKKEEKKGEKKAISKQASLKGSPREKKEEANKGEQDKQAENKAK